MTSDFQTITVYNNESIQENVRLYGSVTLDFSNYPGAKTGTSNMVDITLKNIDRLSDFYRGGAVDIRIPSRRESGTMDTEAGCWIGSR